MQIAYYHANASRIDLSQRMVCLPRIFFIFCGIMASSLCASTTSVTGGSPKGVFVLRRRESVFYSVDEQIITGYIRHNVK